ncbi:MAG: hypothetical protein GY759_17515 [Chloroflexi bacterium]|nr:hypothetical protein [Chloroflexota bacterium]
MSDKHTDQTTHTLSDSHGAITHTYVPTLWFRVTAGLFVLASTWLATEVWRQPGAITIVMFVGVTIIALFLVLQALVRVDYGGETLAYHLPLRPTQRIKRSQITWVERGGRRATALIIGYQPSANEGYVASQTRFVNLPPLNDQEGLLEYLGGETKHRGDQDHGG